MSFVCAWTRRSTEGLRVHPQSQEERRNTANLSINLIDKWEKREAISLHTP